ALRCSCNDQAPLSDCRWEEWTCTIDTSHSACYTRRSMRDDGSIRTDLGCVFTTWNPTFCSKTTETVAIECCVDSDMCNEDLSPTFLPQTPIESPQANSTILRLSPSHTSFLSTTTEGRLDNTAAPPSPTSQPEPQG
ncbi:hypothetical protein GBAR_LOCUS20646, partial [Geodia barretti]